MAKHSELTSKIWLYYHSACLCNNLTKPQRRWYDVISVSLFHIALQKSRFLLSSWLNQRVARMYQAGTWVGTIDVKSLPRKAQKRFHASLEITRNSIISHNVFSDSQRWIASFLSLSNGIIKNLFFFLLLSFQVASGREGGQGSLIRRFSNSLIP